MCWGSYASKDSGEQELGVLDRLGIFGLLGIFVVQQLIKPHCPSALKGLVVTTR